MDVPSWHPANQDSDAARRLLMAPAAVAPRTEFKVMAGSSADTSTDAGRQLMSDLNGGGDSGAAFGGRGFFDASDRLYLQEQRKVEEAQKSKRKAEEDAQLQSFRSTSLKLQQTQKPLLADVVAPTKIQGSADANSSNKKKPLSTVVTIKPKKRSAPTEATSESSKKSRPAKKHQVTAAVESNGESSEVSPRPTSVSKPPTEAATAKPTTPAASTTAGSLLLGYSSSSSDSE